MLYLARVEAIDKEQGDWERAKAHYKRAIELFDFLGNDTMKNSVLEEYNNFLLEELENRSSELEHLIKVSERCDSKKRNYYEMRIKSIENEICEIEKMLG